MDVGVRYAAESVKHSIAELVVAVVGVVVVDASAVVDASGNPGEAEVGVGVVELEADAFIDEAELGALVGVSV